MQRLTYLKSLLSAIDQGYCRCEMIRDADGRPIDYRCLETNDLFERMTGARDGVGRTGRALLPMLDPRWIDACDAVARGTAPGFRGDAEAMGRWFEISVAPVPPAGCFALVLRDITAQHHAEAEREAARATAERLLVELNHRVMNTLSLITSIVRMEAAQVAPDTPGGAAMQRLQARLGAVTALYRALNGAAHVASVDSRAYLEGVVESVSGSVGEAGRIALAAEVVAVELPTTQAVPLGLMVNELMTNALKHAFPGGRRGRLTVALAPEPDTGRLRLQVSDDGVGMDAGRPVADDAAGAGLDAGTAGGGIGSRLIEAFVTQLDGEMTRHSGPQGTTVTVVFTPLAPAALPESLSDRLLAGGLEGPHAGVHGSLPHSPPVGRHESVPETAPFATPDAPGGTGR